MELFKRRPLALACFFFLLSLALSFFTAPRVKNIVFLCVLILFAVFVILFIKKKRLRNAVFSVLLSLLFVALALVLSHFAFDIGFHDLQKYVGATSRITAEVKSITYRENFASYLEISVSEIGGEKIKTNMKLECSYRFPYEEGERFSAEVWFSALEENINGYREKMTGVSKGQSLVAHSEETESLVFIEGAGFDPIRFAKKLNLMLDGILSDALSADSGLSRALLLGNKDALGKSAERDIRYVGVSHLFALSGMHLSIIIGNIGWLLLALGVSKKPRILILAPLAFSYVILTGARLSMVRSALMLLIAYIAFFVGHERDLITSLFLSVTVICAVRPGALFDIGLELSFLSMFGILIFSEPLQKFYGRLFAKIKNDVLFVIVEYVCMSLSISFVAAMSVMPAVWFYFGETSLFVMPGNLIFTPFVTLILMLSPFVILFYKIPFLGTITAFFVGRLSHVMLDICAFFARRRGVLVSLGYPFAPFVIFAVFAVIFVMLVIKVDRKWLFSLPAVLGIAAFALCFAIYTDRHAGELCAVYLSDNGNDGFTVVSEGRMLVCDVSSGSYGFSASLVHAGNELAACEVDTYMLTHYHTRHAATFRRLCSEIFVRNLLLPEPSDEDEYEISRALADIAKENGVTVSFYDSDAEDRVSFGSIKIDTCRRTLIKRSVQPVIALSFTNASARLTYIGPAVNESELYEIFMPAVRDSDAIVFGAHGPKIKSVFSYGTLSPKLKIALFANRSVKDAIDAADTDFVFSLGRADIVADVGKYRFVFD